MAESASSRRIHAPSFLNPHRVLCGKNVWGVLIVVRTVERVTCERCKQMLKRVAAMEKREGATWGS